MQAISIGVRMSATAACIIVNVSRLNASLNWSYSFEPIRLGLLGGQSISDWMMCAQCANIIKPKIATTTKSLSAHLHKYTYTERIECSLRDHNELNAHLSTKWARRAMPHHTHAQSQAITCAHAHERTVNEKNSLKMQSKNKYKFYLRLIWYWITNWSFWRNDDYLFIVVNFIVIVRTAIAAAEKH